MNADLFAAAFAELLKGLQIFFHYNENLFSTKRKTFFNEVKIFFQRYEKVETKALLLIFMWILPDKSP